VLALWVGTGLSGVAVDCRGGVAEFVTKRHAGFAWGLMACHMELREALALA
jgi:hypothetical protein